MKTLVIPDDVYKVLETLSKDSGWTKGRILEEALGLFMEYQFQNPIGPPISSDEAVRQIILHFTSTFNPQVSRCV